MLLCFWRVARPSHLERLWADGVDDALTAVQHPLPWALGSQSNSRDSQLTHYSPSFVPGRLNLLCDARLCLKVPYYNFFFQIQICKNYFDLQKQPTRSCVSSLLLQRMPGRTLQVSGRRRKQRLAGGVNNHRMVSMRYQRHLWHHHKRKKK